VRPGGTGSRSSLSDETNGPVAGDEAGTDVAVVEHDAPTSTSPTEADAAALLERALEVLGDAVVAHALNHGAATVRVTPDAWRRAAELCKSRLGCDYLSFVAGIDWMPTPPVPGAEEGSGDTSSPVQPSEETYGVVGSEGRFQVFACVRPTAGRSPLVLFTDCPDPAAPSAQSWVSVYPGADWHERETWEMYGITFDGHPGLRHLYLPGEFEGNPLRKDFPLLSREIKPWPGLVDVEAAPGGDE
jgi:NADH-quinone oxidoreductase subunit C